MCLYLFLIKESKTSGSANIRGHESYCHTRGSANSPTNPSFQFYKTSTRCRRRQRLVRFFFFATIFRKNKKRQIHTSYSRACGGNCHQNVTTDSCGSQNILDSYRHFLPSVSSFNTHIMKNTGHAMNLHYNSQLTFDVVERWINSHI